MQNESGLNRIHQERIANKEKENMMKFQATKSLMLPLERWRFLFGPLWKPYVEFRRKKMIFFLFKILDLDLRNGHSDPDSPKTPVAGPRFNKSRSATLDNVAINLRIAYLFQLLMKSKVPFPSSALRRGCVRRRRKFWRKSYDLQTRTGWLKEGQQHQA